MRIGDRVIIGDGDLGTVARIFDTRVDVKLDKNGRTYRVGKLGVWPVDPDDESETDE